MKTLGFRFEAGGNHAAPNDDWQRTATGYRVTFRYEGRQASFDFWQGSAITEDPTAGDVMYCLTGDARLGDESFHDFCSEMGYDEDSRSAERTWKACQKIDTQLRALFGADYSEALDTDWEAVQS